MQVIKTIIFESMLVGTLFMFSTYWYFDNSKAFGDILAFLSIVTGFVVTGLSIIATSSFSKELYKQEDTKDNSKTLLHILVEKFVKSTKASVITIVLILLYFFIDGAKLKVYEFWETEISFKHILSSMIWLSTVFSVIYFVCLIDIFAKFVIQTAKK
ncbi:hypothetical protein [Myroides sp. DW712]|uniref:hypothetical protein n=1 Tax=Myroides sp. DW712 TaxID=3389800 RepID=UPI00397C29E3